MEIKRGLSMEKRILLISPHFQVFIKNQAAHLLPEIDKLNVILPLPGLSKTLIRIPYIQRHFRFLEMAVQSVESLSDNFKIIKSKYFTLPIEFIRKRNSLLASRSCIKTINKYQLRFNLIHSHFMLESVIGAKIKEEFSKPLIITAHGGDIYDLPFKNEWYLNLSKYVVNNVDHVIAVSKFISNKIQKLGCPSEKISIIPNGFSEKQFLPKDTQQTRTELGLPEDKKILLSVGNLIPIKGHKYLIKAMCMVIKERPDVLLLIIGEGHLKELLKKRIKQLDLKENIQLLGRKEHYAIPNWMNASDVLVLPSLGEGFPTVIPEAMACGKPVIASRVGGIPEIIQNDKLGRLIEPRNYSDLAHAISNALTLEWNSKYISNYANRYSWSFLSHKILEVYKRVLAENGV